MVRQSRAPQGARGLKCRCTAKAAVDIRSRPARGAWIEIKITIVDVVKKLSRPARGAWIEMLMAWRYMGHQQGRAPQGARGLKFRGTGRIRRTAGSRPARGAWIEMLPCKFPNFSRLSRPARGAWIEMLRVRAGATRGHGRAPQGARGLKFCNRHLMCTSLSSRPARGAWIEMCQYMRRLDTEGVAPRKGRMD